LITFQTIRDRKIRVGLIGCGRISKNHFGSFQSYPEDIQLIAVCDVDLKALAEHSSRYGVPGYVSLKDMLENELLDLVVLCTPSGLHPDQAVMAARYGVGSISEKPMATRWEDGLRMVRACDNAGVRLFVVKQNRRNPTLQLLKRATDEKRFGKIHLVQINVFWTRPQSYYDQGDGWRGTWEFDGGAFMNQASHYVDMLEWLIGPVETVHAMTSTTRNIEAEDTGVLNLRWRNGALGGMSMTMLAYPKNLEGSITILGECGTVRLGGVAVNEAQIWDFSEKRDYDQEVCEASYATTSVYGFGHPLYYRNVVDVMRGEAKPETNGRAGLKSLEILTAAYRSARDGVAVSLPLDVRIDSGS
jgi:UDP-N-acetyl-2-amino-2-deoxyglucuronate dehydrogenase